jgi:RNA ligase (TIGR02306 family)
MVVSVVKCIPHYRKLASIQTISDLAPIEGADKIETASFKKLGWKCVVKKGEFQVGDFCVFFEIDSLLKPKEWNSFLHDKKIPEKLIRLHTVKMRGQVSQGLAMPLSVIPEIGENFCNWHPADCLDPEGIDVTELLEVQKWEPQSDLNAEERPKANFPFYIPKSDTLRIQSYPDALAEFQGRECYGTIKIDGTSSTFFQRNGEFGVCMRNLEIYDTPTSKYWRMARKYKIQENLDHFRSVGSPVVPVNILIQGETYGPGVQKNKLGLKELDLSVYDIFDIDAGKYLNYYDQQAAIATLGLQPVQTVFLGKFEWKTVDELIDYAATLMYPNGTPAEGIVIRPIIETRSEVLTECHHRMAIKAISPVFLMRYKE